MNSVSKANERQVAGTHYKGVAIQHWDYAAANGLDYFEGQITKYVSRWRKKHPTAAGRLDDIQKALHFAEKFAEVTADTQRTLGVVNTAVWMGLLALPDSLSTPATSVPLTSAACSTCARLTPRSSSRWSASASVAATT